MIFCDIISLGQTCKTTKTFHLENIRVSDILDIHALNNQLESLTEEVIDLIQTNKKQHHTLNRVQNTLNNVKFLLEQLCSGN